MACEQEQEVAEEAGPRMADYSPVPPYFTEDLFSCLPPDQRPPHRWVLVGAKNSGSAIHKDPLHSSAWNHSLLGRKRWVLFPPETPRYWVAPRRVGELHPSPHMGPSAWFTHIYPRCCPPPSPAEGACGGGAQQQRQPGVAWRVPGAIELIQQPGETVYVPAGWWHVVINLDELSVRPCHCSAPS